MQARLLLDEKALLGEGAIWNHEQKMLYWVDIEGGYFHTYTPSTQKKHSYLIGKRVGTVVPAGANMALLAIEDGIALIDLLTGIIDYKINTGIHHDGKRFNDGKCDPSGRFWVGSMSVNDIPKVGSLYYMNNDFTLTEKICGVSISNGIAWANGGDIMYYIDTPTKKVVKYDLTSGDLTNPEVVIDIPADSGYPDGMTIDNEGMLWIALWDGFGIARYNPSTGKLMEKIDVPAPKVTSCAFGGENLDTLFITTARVEMTPEELEKYPHSGGVFVADVKTRGVKAHHFKI